MSIPDSLIDLETCPRKAFFSRSWAKRKIRAVDGALEAIKAAVVAPNAQETTFGDLAGSTVLALAADPGFEYAEGINPYDHAMHYACLADIIASVLRKQNDPPWESIDSSYFRSPDGQFLRRIILVSHWTKDRHYGECRNWRTLYPMALEKLPMQIAVVVVGQERNGKRHSHWTKCLRHTIGKTNIRFRRRVGNTSGGFKDSWTEIWREDHEEISREAWLSAMLKDDVMRDLCMTVEMPALPQWQRDFFSDLANRKMEMIEKTKDKPPLQLSGCDWPVKCPFLRCCHVFPEKEPSEKLGFVRISTRRPHPQASTNKDSGILAGPGSPVSESLQPPPA